ncbi:MAG TPA: hypothetical protein VHR45_07460 [Thermoanaerobaculia bacterium]|nr:hypothetical protein [Thermoanaerobaculia bacterium]
MTSFRVGNLAAIMAAAAFLSCASSHIVAANRLSADVTSDSTMVAAVQSDNDDTIDLASEFLSGRKFCCRDPQPGPDCRCVTWTFHAPSAWSHRQLHVNGNPPDFQRDYSEFYWHRTVAGGMAESRTDGLDSSRILYYVGEGTPPSFEADFNRTTINLDKFSLGERDVRYLFMLSCNLFAQGRRPIPDPTSNFAPDFTRPQNFDPAQVRINQDWTESDYMADVFYRWGKYYEERRSPLNPHLRLACGGSSRISGGSEYPTHLFWYYSNVLRLRPADLRIPTEAGQGFRGEGGHPFRGEGGHCSEVKAATC